MLGPVLRRRNDPRTLPHARDYERWDRESAVAQKFLTVDQEVGGSSPPSCTNEINDLIGQDRVLGAPVVITVSRR
jgi:hypothetical protein